MGPAAFMSSLTTPSLGPAELIGRHSRTVPSIVGSEVLTQPPRPDALVVSPIDRPRPLMRTTDPATDDWFQRIMGGTVDHYAYSEKLAEVQAAAPHRAASREPALAHLQSVFVLLEQNQVIARLSEALSAERLARTQLSQCLSAERLARTQLERLLRGTAPMPTTRASM